jgi:hypothetical protein
MPMPIPDPDAAWPSCDDQQPGISIRPLRHGDLAALLDHLHQHDQDLDGDPAWPAALAPVVAVRVRATVGRPGASAQATYRRHRAAEWAAWTRSLPWRAAIVLAAGVGIGLLAAMAVPRLAGPVGLLAAAVVGWALRFRVSPATSAWRRGAAGERHTARLLTRLEDRGWVVLHDLAIPDSRANIDCLAIGPGGVVVIDSKQYRGRLRLDESGCLWHGRYLLTAALRAVRWEAEHGANLPRGRLEVDGITVAPARRVADLLWTLPPLLGPERVSWLADRARRRFRPAA